MTSATGWEEAVVSSWSGSVPEPRAVGLEGGTSHNREATRAVPGDW